MTKAMNFKIMVVALIKFLWLGLFGPRRRKPKLAYISQPYHSTQRIVQKNPVGVLGSCKAELSFPPCTGKITLRCGYEPGHAGAHAACCPVHIPYVLRWK